MKDRHYSLKNILSKHANINMIIGEKSNGKTYACKEYLIKRYFDGEGKGAYIRRTDEDFKKGRGDAIFSDMIKNKNGVSLIEKYSKGKFNTIKYMVNGWYLGKTYVSINRKGEYVEKVEYEDKPFCYAFSVNNAEHTNGQSYLDITTIFFDEFTTTKNYLVDEFSLYNILLSNIIRDRDNVQILMCGNTVDRHCIYFREMGLNKILKMEKGTIDIYTFNVDDGRVLTVAVEYCDTSVKNGKKSDLYFAFDNPTLKMIKKGDWDLNIYPHLRGRFKEENIYQVFYVKYNDTWLKCYIYNYNDNIVLFFTPASKPIITEDTIIFRNDDIMRKNDYRHLRNGGKQKLFRIIDQCFNLDRVYFATNESGDIIRKYLVEIR